MKASSSQPLSFCTAPGWLENKKGSATQLQTSRLLRATPALPPSSRSRGDPPGSPSRCFLPSNTMREAVTCCHYHELPDERRWLAVTGGKPGSAGALPGLL